ncbi:MAG: hypothetical protein CM1200mP14_28220 [Gammaproteobacteria bacterium]|nr:MAG: hypothetical protein CM1200mP14_28220 [Gammaproteobacteria bacterium]
MRAFQSSLFLTLAAAGTVVSYACSGSDFEAEHPWIYPRQTDRMSCITTTVN